MNIHFSTLRSVCRFQTCGGSMWNESRTKIVNHYCCDHRNNLDGDCKEFRCPLRKKTKLSEIKPLKLEWG